MIRVRALADEQSIILPSTATSFSHIMPTSLPVSRQASGPSLYDEDDSPTLRPTYDALIPTLVEDVVVILDGLSELLSIGFEPAEVTRFVRAVNAQTRSVSFAKHPDDKLMSALRRPRQHPSCWPAGRYTPTRARAAGWSCTHSAGVVAC